MSSAPSGVPVDGGEGHADVRQQVAVGEQLRRVLDARRREDEGAPQIVAEVVQRGEVRQGEEPQHAADAGSRTASSSAVSASLELPSGERARRAAMAAARVPACRASSRRGRRSRA